MPNWKSAWLGFPLLLSGCCYFTPCHPGTYVAGTVTDGTSNQGIADASVLLYHYETQTSASGCFSFGGPDALPFEFRVSANGYKPVKIEAIPGSYQATIVLIPEDTPGDSYSKLREVSREEYAALSQVCSQ